MRGDSPSAGVAMLALLRGLPTSAPSCASARHADRRPRPPRPKLLVLGVAGGLVEARVVPVVVQPVGGVEELGDRRHLLVGGHERVERDAYAIEDAGRGDRGAREIAVRVAVRGVDPRVRRRCCRRSRPRLPRATDRACCSMC